MSGAETSTCGAGDGSSATGSFDAAAPTCESKILDHMDLGLTYKRWRKSSNFLTFQTFTKKD